MTAEDLMDLEEELAARGIEAGDICAVFIP